MSDQKMDNAEARPQGPEDTMALSLEGQGVRTEAGLVSVPSKPTAAMLAAGARAAGVSVEAAWKIYRAMVLHRD